MNNLLLLGTSNPGKLREFSLLLANLPVRLLSLRDAGLESLEIDEPYETFAENAIHKAQAYAQASGLPAFADDSGLNVDALGGRPGVYSARYGGPTDRDRYMKLLGELEAVPDDRRSARFVCVAAVVDAQREIVETADGVVEGRIARAPGDPTNGFGYDAVFVPDGYDMVFSELPSGEKNHISHRGRAARGLIPALRRLFDS
ncbi:MAG: RdgB/HAM1 family non-canonical purine NTP pyrophosphatase [Anaerolineae bacterium]|nr:RdgB/HAM1 family non-canonical purine NTP pyrophosphatase [Anaerolineae bacterium]